MNTKRLILLVGIVVVIVLGAGVGVFLWQGGLPWSEAAEPSVAAAQQPTPTEPASAPSEQQPTPTREMSAAAEATSTREAAEQAQSASPTPTPTPRFVRPTPTPTRRLIRFKAFVSPLRAQLKAAPDPNAAPVAVLRGGQVLEMIGRTEASDWILVVYPPESEGSAWIPADQLRIYNDISLLPVVEPTAAVLVTPTPEPEAETQTEAPSAAPTTERLPAVVGKVARITADVLNVRAGPSTRYAVIHQLKLNEEVEVVGRNEDGSWLLVIYDRATDARGWIYAEYAEVGEGVEDLPVATTTAQPVTAPQSQRTSFTGKLAILTSSGGELYLVNADGSGLRRVTAGVLDPDLSPDGTKVAYARWPGGPDPEGIYVRDLTNDNEWRQWGTHLPRTPDWSPDGRALVFSFQRGGREGYEEVERCFGPFCFSFTLGPDPNWRLGYVDTWTGEYRDVPSVPYSANPSWAPDGERIVYHDDRGIEVTTLHGPSRALNQELRHKNPVWSPAGGLIAFEYKYQDHTDIYVMNEDGTGVRPLTQSDPLLGKAVNNVSPTWSPDGQWIAFLTDRNGQWEVYVMRPDGSQQQPLFPNGLPITIQHSTVGERLLSWSR
ncbi:MAG: hypothetical protein Kow0047_19920 [Anaerolineae bacterium]